MLLEISTVCKDSVAEITLAGELRRHDADSSALFEAELAKLAETSTAKLTRLVLHVEKLSYLASIGVRLLLKAKNIQFPGLAIYIVAPQEMVLDTLERTGVAKDFFIVKAYPPAGE